MKKWALFLLFLCIVSLGHAENASLYHIQDAKPWPELDAKLSALQEQLKSEAGWKETQVPMGEYTFGKEIPAKAWIITANRAMLRLYHDKVDKYHQFRVLNIRDNESVFLNMTDKHAIKIELNGASFSPWVPGAFSFYFLSTPQRSLPSSDQTEAAEALRALHQLAFSAGPEYVILPVGVYQVPRDIPAGYYFCYKACSGLNSDVFIGQDIDDTGTPTETYINAYLNLESATFSAREEEIFLARIRDGDTLVVNYLPLALVPYRSPLGF